MDDENDLHLFIRCLTVSYINFADPVFPRHDIHKVTVVISWSDTFFLLLPSYIVIQLLGMHCKCTIIDQY